jgi:hypothetical protein
MKMDKAQNRRGDREVALLFNIASQKIDHLLTLIERIDELAASAEGPWVAAIRVRCAEALKVPMGYPQNTPLRTSNDGK